ncbi:MAG: hypothetical protein CSB44_10500 [Gammaproteobacteria bacterium]|nr:MAG: hypothetical protein CSB44_10500 [Gammaproteobacteria bacterium]
MNTEVRNRFEYPLNIRLVGVGDHLARMLEYYFTHDGARYYRQTTNYVPEDCILVDPAHPGARLELERHHHRDGLPCLVVGEHPDFELPGHYAAITLREPLDFAALESAAHAVEDLLLSTPEENGDRAALRQDGRTGAGSHRRFKPENHVCGFLKKQLSLLPDDHQGLSFELPSLDLFALPSDNLLFANRSLSSITSDDPVYAELDPDSIDVEFWTDTRPVIIARTLRTRDVLGYPLDAFLWRCALSVSAGRVPSTVDVEQPKRLTKHPAYIDTHHSDYWTELAERWREGFHSLNSAIADFGIPEGYVIAFHNAADLLDLFDIGTDHHES